MGDLLIRIMEMYSKTDKVKIVIFLCVAFIIIPIISDYYYAPYRIEKKIELTEKVYQLKNYSDENPEFIGLYFSSLSDVYKIRIPDEVFSIKFEFPRSIKLFLTNQIFILKFLSGSFISLVIIFISLINYEKDKIFKLFVIGFLIICTMVLGILGLIIPTFKPLTINIIGFPVFQLIMLTAMNSVWVANNIRRKEQAKTNI